MSSSLNSTNLELVAILKKNNNKKGGNLSICHSRRTEIALGHGKYATRVPDVVTYGFKGKIVEGEHQLS